MNHPRAAIVGGGIAGAAVAYALSKRGIKSFVFESNSGFASGASGNPIGLVYPFLTKHKTVESEFSLSAFTYFLTIWEKEKLGQYVSSKDGLFYLLHSNELKERYLPSIKNHNLSSDNVVFEKEPKTQIDSMFFKFGKSLAPKELTSKLFELGSVQTFWEEEVISFETGEDKIYLTTSKQNLELNYLFICNSYDSKRFTQTNWFPSKKVRGQILICDKKYASLPHSILFGDYITTDLKGEFVIGASFDEFKTETTARDSESLALLEGVAPLGAVPLHHLEFLKTNLNEMKTRVSFRNQSEDRRPILGKLADFQTFTEEVKKSKQKQGNFPKIPYFNNIGVVLSLGSRGLTHALWSAELTVSQVLGENMDNLISKKILDSVATERFLLRMWKRGQIPT